MPQSISSDAFIPLIATVAYAPLFVILVMNRPWERRHRLFFLFLLPAMLWSLATFLFRSHLLMEHKLLLCQVIISVTILMLVQFHLFIRSFYETERVKIPWAYGFPIATIVLAVLGVIPRGIEVTAGRMSIDYGPWIVAIGFGFLLTVGMKDIRSLLVKRQVSHDPAERNEAVYLLFAIVILIVFILIAITPRGGEFPVSHFGNLAIAAVFTHAVVAHRLLDVRVIFRQAVINAVLYGSGLSMVLVVSWAAHSLGGIDPSFASLAATIALGIPFILLLVYRLGTPWRARMERAMVGERYAHRRRLFQFISRIHSVPALEEMANELVALLSESVDSKRACLLLPRPEDGAFIPRFAYPPLADNPMKDVRLLADSPVITWMRRERSVLPVRELSIRPEFQSMWGEERESIRSAEAEVFIPLVHSQGIAAIMAISGRRHGKLYTVEDMHLLESITNQVAVILEKEYFHEQLREQGKEITMLNRLATIVTSSMSIDSIFEGFVRELREMVNFDWATITVVDSDEVHILALASNIGSPWTSDGRVPLAGTATEHVWREGKTVYEPDLSVHQRFTSGKHHLEQGVRSVVYLPLQIKEECIGAFIVASQQRDAFAPRHIKLLEQVALQIATPIENSQLWAKAEQRSRIDELTGLFNRRHFEERMREEISRHGRHGNVFSIFLLDLDGFKTYNDIYGHPSGDVVLAHLARVIRGSIRNADQAFRYGGDEFTVILPETKVDDAYVVAERVRMAVEDEMKGKEIAVTCSIGLAGYPSDGVMSGELVTVADTAQYFAKRTGGNRVYLPSKVLSEPLDDFGVSARHSGLSAIYALVSTVEAKDPCTYGHSRRVNTYAVALAEAVGLSSDQVSRVSTAALLHDIGKIGVPDRVLNRKRKLGAEDWELIKTHPRLGATIVGNIPNLIPCVSSILHHHERWDGGGYPEGLKGEEISIEARILAVADAYEAMSSARPYRAALSTEKVLNELRRCAGSQLDPELVEVFIGIIEAGLPDEAGATEQAAAEKTGS